MLLLFDISKSLAAITMTTFHSNWSETYHEIAPQMFDHLYVSVLLLHASLVAEQLSVALLRCLPHCSHLLPLYIIPNKYAAVSMDMLRLNWLETFSRNLHRCMTVAMCLRF